MLKSHCDGAGRDYDTIEKTVSTFIDTEQEPARVLEHLSELSDLGIQHAIVSPRGPWDEATLNWVAAMVAEAHTIGAGV